MPSMMKAKISHTRAAFGLPSKIKRIPINPHNTPDAVRA
jgi:hypothetical protein